MTTVMSLLVSRIPIGIPGTHRSSAYTMQGGWQPLGEWEHFDAPVL